MFDAENRLTVENWRRSDSQRRVQRQSQFETEHKLNERRVEVLKGLRREADLALARLEREASLAEVNTARAARYAREDAVQRGLLEEERTRLALEAQQESEIQEAQAAVQRQIQRLRELEAEQVEAIRAEDVRARLNTAHTITESRAAQIAQVRHDAEVRAQARVEEAHERLQQVREAVGARQDTATRVAPEQSHDMPSMESSRGAAAKPSRESSAHEPAKHHAPASFGVTWTEPREILRQELLVNRQAQIMSRQQGTMTARASSAGVVGAGAAAWRHSSDSHSVRSTSSSQMLRNLRQTAEHVERAVYQNDQHYDSGAEASESEGSTLVPSEALYSTGTHTTLSGDGSPLQHQEGCERA